MCFDDGSKLLLFAYESSPSYATHYQYANKDCSPDRRHKSNNINVDFLYYSFKLMIPGKIYHKEFGKSEEYESILQILGKMHSDAEIKKVMLGRNLTDKSQEQMENVETAKLSPVENEKPPVLMISRDEEECSQKSRLLALVLCLFFGFLGIHDFFAGKYHRGLFYIIFLISSSIFVNTLFNVLAIVFFGLLVLDFFTLMFGKFKDGKKRIIKKWL